MPQPFSLLSSSLMLYVFSLCSLIALMCLILRCHYSHSQPTPPPPSLFYCYHQLRSLQGSCVQHFLTVLLRLRFPSSPRTVAVSSSLLTLVHFTHVSVLLKCSTSIATCFWNKGINLYYGLNKFPLTLPKSKSSILWQKAWQSEFKSVSDKL